MAAVSELLKRPPGNLPGPGAGRACRPRFAGVGTTAMVVALAVLSLALSGRATAQTGEDLPAAVASLSDAVATSSLDDEAREAATQALDSARGAFTEAARLRVELARLQAETEFIATEQADLEARLAAGPGDSMDAWRERLPEDAETETLEGLLINQRETLAALDGQIDDISQALVDILSGPASAAGEIELLQQRVLRLENETQQDGAGDELLADAEALRRTAERQAARAALALRQFEQDSGATRQEYYELALRELHLRRERYEERVDILQTRVAAQGRTQLAALVEVLQRRADELVDAPAVVASAAAQNATLGQEFAFHSEGLGADRSALAASQETQDQVARTLRDARTRLEVGGTSQLVGRWLWSERQRLESQASMQARLNGLRDDLAALRLAEVVLSEQRDALENRRADAQGLSQRAGEATVDGESAAATSAALAPLLRQQFELLTLKEPLLRQRIETIEEQERVLSQTAQDTQELQRLFDRYLLSAPSHAPVDLDWLRRFPEGIGAALSLGQLQDAARDVRPPTLAVAGILLPGIILLLVLFRLQRQAGHRIAALADPPRSGEPGGFRATALALAWTLVAALPLPLVLFLLGAYLGDVGVPGGIGYSLGEAAGALAGPLYAVLVLYWTCRDEGLAHRHFHWSAARRGTLRRMLPVTFGTILTMVFLSSLALARGVEASSDVLARVAIIVASLSFAAGIWTVLGPNRLWAVAEGDTEPTALRKLLRVALTLLAASVAWFALQGFIYSASQLLFDMLQTFSVLVAITLVVGLIGRWLLLSERRLAASREEEDPDQPVVVDDGEGGLPAEPELSLQDVNAQTRRLLSALRIALIIGAVLWIWAEAFPAFTRLEEIVLWRVAVPGVDGQPESQAITLLAVLAGIVTLMITIAGARNLPGLIEIVLANYTKVDAPSRYAVTSVLRYAIIIAGTLLALALVGMQWSRLQWLAAALTVGLGFGLQEIFANFVSGLILLFERQFRVGDIITVGELSGRVTRIRTRATTILDFDNREIVIPNKEFITGQLVNWTLTDSTTRLTVTVGVAYGTSPPLVHQLLRRAAKEHPLVLDDPEPLSWFMEFGPSSLDFNLLVFVASPRDRFPVKDALNTRIAELFAEHDVEIAFPQLDLHVRSTPPAPTPPSSPGPGEPPAPATS